jgi:hypothetical protein
MNGCVWVGSPSFEVAEPFSSKPPPSSVAGVERKLTIPCALSMHTRTCALTTLGYVHVHTLVLQVRDVMLYLCNDIMVVVRHRGFFPGPLSFFILRFSVLWGGVACNHFRLICLPYIPSANYTAQM